MTKQKQASTPKDAEELKERHWRAEQRIRQKEDATGYSAFCIHSPVCGTTKDFAGENGLGAAWEAKKYMAL